jgi:ribosomal protein S18 acetylase RimI-like enzyme
VNAFISRIRPEDISEIVGLQRECFPPPFPEELLWTAEHLRKHLELYPEGQFLARMGHRIVGSASACRISEGNWLAHQSWEDTVGGFNLERHDPGGSTLFGLDISVHPDFRRQGLGRLLYQARFELVREAALARFGTACRMPDYQAALSKGQTTSQEEYAQSVVLGTLTDRTMSPLLRYGLRFQGIIHDHMEDEESGNAAAILVWTP